MLNQKTRARNCYRAAFTNDELSSILRQESALKCPKTLRGSMYDGHTIAFLFNYRTFRSLILPEFRVVSSAKFLS